MLKILTFYSFLSFIFIVPLTCVAEDLFIHTDKDSYYYQGLENQDTIVLPNHEIIDTGDLIKLDEGETFRTREGLEIYKAYDGQLFLEESEEEEK